MQVDVNELKFILENAPNGLFSVVSDNLNKAGFKTTRFVVAKEISSIQTKREYKQEIIDETRRVLTLLTGLSYHNQFA